MVLSILVWWFVRLSIYHVNNFFGNTYTFVPEEQKELQNSAGGSTMWRLMDHPRVNDRWQKILRTDSVQFIDRVLGVSRG